LILVNDLSRHFHQDGGMSSMGANRTAGTAFVRREREFETVTAMLRLYCQGHHHPTGPELCPDCGELRAYALLRLQRCPFGEAKPACAHCRVHCYKPDLRERIRRIMRWAGPRMMWHHPILALRHLIDGRRPAPSLKKAG
jgi:hypothetical protein